MAGVPAEPERHDAALRRGALVNAIGLVGKLLYPVLIVVLTRLFGAETMGRYFLAMTVVEVGGSIASTGWADAATLFVSRGVAQGDAGSAISRTTGRILRQSVALAVGLALLVQLGAAPVVGAFFPLYADMVPGLPWLGWALVPFVFVEAMSGVAKAHFAMGWGALFAGLRPLLLLVFAVAIHEAGGGLTALLMSFFATTCLLALVALRPFGHYLVAGDVAAGFARPPFGWDIVRFAVPQSLNHTVSLYLARLDVVFLAAFGTPPAALALYSTAAQLTENLKQVRIVFSTALAPIVVRHHARGERGELARQLTRTSRRALVLTAPLAFVVFVGQRDLLGIFDPGYATMDSSFIGVLVLAALTAAGAGLAGNFLAFTGRSQVNLANSLLVGVSNTVLNALLIPRFALAGAAAATATSAVLLVLLQNVQLARLEGVRMDLAKVGRPWLGWIALGCSLFALGAPWPDRPLLRGLVVVAGLEAGGAVAWSRQIAARRSEPG